MVRPIAGLVLDLGDERTADFASQCADMVVSSFALCSVRDMKETLHEIKRVLRPGGSLVFFEHVAAPPGTIARAMQRVGAAMSSRGCDRERDTISALLRADFGWVEITQVSRTLIAGVAVKRAC